MDNNRIIDVKFCMAGFMKKYMKCGTYDVKLPEGSTMKEWYRYFAENYSCNLTQTVWNEEKERFYRPVKVTVNDARKNADDDYILQDGDVIKITLILTGG